MVLHVDVYRSVVAARSAGLRNTVSREPTGPMQDSVTEQDSSELATSPILLSCRLVVGTHGEAWRFRKTP